MTLNKRFTYPLLGAFSLLTSSITAADAPGGLVEQGAASNRPLLSQSQIASMLPERGKFKFPAPYNTTGVRLTNASDCGGGNCVQPVGYSYWRNINNHVGSNEMLIMVGLSRNDGGTGPTLIRYNKSNDQVTNAGPIFPSNSPYGSHSGEGFYFSGSQATKLYAFSGASLQRYDVNSQQFETVFNLTDEMGSGHTIWQTHSSDDDRVHSATVRSASSYSMLGCAVYQEDIDKFTFYPRKGTYDECQIDRSGDWLVIKEDVDGRDGEDNRIIGVRTGEERVLLDRDGAGGHSDLGHGYMIASDNWATVANTVNVWDFNSNPISKTTVYANNNWSIGAPAHISHTNSRADVAMENQVACGSSANSSNTSQANEIVCFRMDSSKQVLVVAPVMTSMSASGGGDSYNKMPKGNLDITGEYFIWTSNMGGSRLDAFIVKVPKKLLKGNVAPLPAPNGASESRPRPVPAPTTPTPAAASETATGSVIWTNLTNVAVSGSRITKTSGCNGCADARASSAQEITGGNGSIEFTVTEISTLRRVGLTTEPTSGGSSSHDFGLSLQGSFASVYEKGVYKADTSIRTGNVLRISVQDGKVHYLKNGVVFHTSSAAPSYPLRADAVFFSSDSTLADAKFVAGSAAGPAPTASASRPMPERAPASASAKQRLPVKTSGTTSRSMTTAIISGGVTADNGATFVDSIVAPRAVKLDVTIDPEDEHMGQAGRILVVARDVANDRYFSLDESGQLRPFNFTSEMPYVYQTLPELKRIHTLRLFDGVLSKGDRGSVEIYVGYQPDGSDEIYYNEQPIVLTVK